MSSGAAMKIAFIGLGNMGLPIALNLLKAGQDVAVYNRSRARSALAAAQGAKVADRPAAAAAGVEVAISMLADDDAVEAVVLGADGLVAGLPRGALHVSMSTIGVALAERLTEAHAAAGQGYLSAPVFGRPEAAAAAKLFVVAAGQAAAIERCRPLFEAIGQRSFVVGERPSAANTVKLSGNFLLAAVVESLSEAFALIRKSGIDPHLYLDLLTSTLFSAPAYKTYGGLIADQRYQPAGFKMPLALKDVRLALQAAEARSVPMPTASLIRDQLISGLARGHGELDWSALGRVAAENAGIES
jgi:3-hydroxyisobutyrate dehydrogenase-like beta-hydroxyacid dehydrogenase